MGHKHPSPKEINFPEVTKEFKEENFKKIGYIDLPYGESNGIPNYLIKGISFIEDKYIVLGWTRIIPSKAKAVSFFEVYDFNLCKQGKYEIPRDYREENEDEEIMGSLYLSNGKFIVFGCNFYEYDPNQFDKGPERISKCFEDFKGVREVQFSAEVANQIEVEGDFIEKKILYHIGKNFIEISPQKLFFSYYQTYYCTDVSEFNGNAEVVKYEDKDCKNPSGFYLSKITPGIVYSWSNVKKGSSYDSFLFWFKAEDLTKMDGIPVKHEGKIQVSHSFLIYYFGEYDKKYVLCDTFLGLYILDIETKTVAARLSNGTSTFDDHVNSYDFYFYRPLIKLADGNIFKANYGKRIIEVIDILNNKRTEFGNYNKNIVTWYKNEYFLTGGGKILNVFRYDSN